jgi:hypothetical protein
MLFLFHTVHWFPVGSMSGDFGLGETNINNYFQLIKEKT